MKKCNLAMTLLFCMGLISCGNNDNSDTINSDKPYSTSSGYSTDPDYHPTVSNEGDYHTIDGNNRQIQYQGSQEQQRDLDMIDEYMRTHPED